MLALQDAEFRDRCMAVGSEEDMTQPRAFESAIVFESYGVRVKLEATDAALLNAAEQEARKALIDRLEIIDSKEAEHTFGFAKDDGSNLYLFQDGKQISTDDLTFRFYKFFNGILRIVVAEHAPDRVFVHAGVVGWRGRAIVIPALSFRGKTTLVAELIRNGAEYYSDEYAILDEKGLVHAFPRPLSVRDERFHEKLLPIEDLGGKIGVTPIPIGGVILTEFKEGAEWNPERLTVGNGIMEVIPHTIPRHFNTKFALNVLNTAVSDAIILKSLRGEASDVAIKLLSFFDNYLTKKIT